MWEPSVVGQTTSEQQRPPNSFGETFTFSCEAAAEECDEEDADDAFRLCRLLSPPPSPCVHTIPFLHIWSVCPTPQSVGPFILSSPRQSKPINGNTHTHTRLGYVRAVVKNGVQRPQMLRQESPLRAALLCSDKTP